MSDQITNDVNQTPQPNLESIPSVVQEVQTVVLPDGRTLTHEEYLKESSEETEREIKKGKQRKSAFRSSKRFRAGSFKFFDTTFDYAEVPDALLEKYNKDTKSACADVGVKQEDLEAGNLTFKQSFDVFKKLEELVDSVLKECVIDWDDVDYDYDPRLVSDLGFECKQNLFQQIIMSTKMGISQQSFFNSRSSG